MRQITTGCWQGKASKAASGVLAVPQYGVLGGSARFDQSAASSGFREWPMSAAGQFENIRLTLKATPSACGVTSFTYTLLRNLTATGVVIIVSGINTTGEYLGVPIVFNAGDRFRWECAQQPPFGAIITMDLPDLIQTVEYVSIETGVSLYWSRGLANLPVPTAYNGVFNPTDSFGLDINVFRSVIVIDGAITRYDVLLGEAPTVRGTSMTYVLILDGVVQDGTAGTVDTRLVVTTLTTGTWTGSLHLDPLTQQHIVLRATSTGFASDGVRTSYCVKFVATQDGQFWVGGYNGNPPSNAAVEYQVATANDVSHQWEVTEAWKALLGSVTPYTLASPRVWLAVAPDPGRSRTLDVLYDGVAAPPTVTLSGTDRIVTGTGSILIEDGHTWNWRHTPTNTPNGTVDGMAWAFIGDATPPPPECPGILGPTRTDGLPYTPPDVDPCEGTGTTGPARTGQ